MTDKFISWFCGLIDGEGSFGLYETFHKTKGYYYLKFHLHLRVDDFPMLEYVKENMKVGLVKFNKHGFNGEFNVNPNVHYYICNTKDLLKLVEALDKGELFSKKKYEYEIFRRCVLLKQDKKNARHPYLEYACGELHRLKRFNPSCLDNINYEGFERKRLNV